MITDVDMIWPSWWPRCTFAAPLRLLANQRNSTMLDNGGLIRGLGLPPATRVWRTHSKPSWASATPFTAVTLNISYSVGENVRGPAGQPRFAPSAVGRPSPTCSLRNARGCCSWKSVPSGTAQLPAKTSSSSSTAGPPGSRAGTPQHSCTGASSKSATVRWPAMHRPGASTPATAPSSNAAKNPENALRRTANTVASQGSIQTTAVMPRHRKPSMNGQKHLRCLSF